MSTCHRTSFTLKKYIALYLREINKYKQCLSADEERLLLSDIKRGDYESFHNLLMSSQYIVLEEVLYFTNSGVEISDLIQEANEACINAIYNYDFSNLNLKNYLHRSIYIKLSNFVDSYNSTIRYPSNVIDKINEITKWFENNCPKQESEVSTANTIDALNDVTDRPTLISGFYDTDINSFRNEFITKMDVDIDNVMFSEASDPDRGLIIESLKYEIQRSLYTLSDREAEVIKLSFGINREKELTLEEIGERLNLTRERIRQIKEKALLRLHLSSISHNLLGFRELYSYIKYPEKYCNIPIYNSYYEVESDVLVDVIKYFVRPFRRITDLPGIDNQSKECRRLVRKFLEMNNEPVQMEDIKYYILEVFPGISQNIINYAIRTTAGVINVKKGFYALEEWGYIENTVTTQGSKYERSVSISHITDILKEQEIPISETYLLSKIQLLLERSLSDKEKKRIFRIIGKENSIIRTLDNKYYLLAEEFENETN